MKKYMAAGAVVLAAFAVIRAQEPTTPAELIRSAEAAVRKADYATADALYAKAAAQPDSPAILPALLYLGVRARGSRNPLAAEGFFERILKIDSKSAQAGPALTWLAGMGMRSDAEAEELYKRALEIESPTSVDYVDTLRKYSIFARKQGRLAEAQELEARAVEAQTGRPRPKLEDLPPGVYRTGDGITAPSLILKREPEYTEDARAGKIQGTSILGVDISPEGIAGNFQVLRSLEPGLDQKAIEAVQQWRFKPGTKDGEPVTVRATIEVNFRLM